MKVLEWEIASAQKTCAEIEMKRNTERVRRMSRKHFELKVRNIECSISKSVKNHHYCLLAYWERTTQRKNHFPLSIQCKSGKELNKESVGEIEPKKVQWEWNKNIRKANPQRPWVSTRSLNTKNRSKLWNEFNIEKIRQWQKGKVEEFHFHSRVVKKASFLRFGSLTMEKISYFLFSFDFSAWNSLYLLEDHQNLKVLLHSNHCWDIICHS